MFFGFSDPNSMPDDALLDLLFIAAAKDSPLSRNHLTGKAHGSSRLRVPKVRNNEFANIEKENLQKFQPNMQKISQRTNRSIQRHKEKTGDRKSNRWLLDDTPKEE